MLYVSEPTTQPVKLLEPLDRPANVAAYILTVRPGLDTEPHEEAWVVMVDARLAPVGAKLVGLGSSNQSGISIARVLREVLIAGAAGFFLVHNHPSGNVEASADDRRFRSRLRAAAEIVFVDLHDSIIIGRGGACGIA